MMSIGVDVGSTYTKYCILDTASKEMQLSIEQSPVRQQEYFDEKIKDLRDIYPEANITSCGYGRENIKGAETVSELTALAQGSFSQCPDMTTVLDIGGQDTKIIKFENGQIKRFFLNEKCAAGCGMFLSNVLHLLNVRFCDVSLDAESFTPLRLSSTCAVFAQSEIVSLIAGGVSESEIIDAVIVQVLTQAKALLGKVRCDRLALSGGLGLIPGISACATGILGVPVEVAPRAPYLSAIGCALIGSAAKNI